MTLFPLIHKRLVAPALVGILGIVFVSLSGCASGVAGKRSDAGKAAAPVRVESVPVAIGKLRRNVEAVGSLFAREEVTISSEVDGRVDKVLVDVGDEVEAGQPLVEVSTIELQLALDQQRALFQQARARLGLSGESGDLQNVLDAAEVKKAAADLKEAQDSYNRSKLLLEKQLLPKQDFDTTESRVNSVRAAYDLAIQTVQNLRAQLPQYKAAVELAEKKLRDAVIRAPFKGEIKERVVAPGQYLKVQTPVMVVVSVDPMRARLKIPETMAEWVRVGNPITVTVDAYPNRMFSGKLARINPSVDPQSRTFEVEAEFENSDRLLKPGFFVKARVPSDKVDEVLTVPQTALQYSYGVYKIFLIQGDELKETEVKVGEALDDRTEVLSGLKAGDIVAVAAQGQTLQEGVKIQITQ